MSGLQVFQKKIGITLLGVLLASCGTDDGSSASQSTVGGLSLAAKTSAGAAIAAATVQVTGKITYDFVPATSARDAQNKWSAKLDYTQTVQKPARDVVVELVDSNNNVLLSTTTNDQGNYVFDAPSQKAGVHIRVKAQMLRTAAQGVGPAWNFSIKDESSAGYGTAAGASLFAMDGSAFDTGTTNTTRNLNAASGWSTAAADYTTTRSAAPFAILDTVYAAREKVRSASANLVFPPLNVYWSPGSTDGTYFDPDNSENTAGLHILGQQNVDTDEYDAGVIAHEWGHYFQASFSRDDSTGGQHGSGNLLDMRLAFSEGWGNAFSSMARNDPIYVDTYGSKQGSPAVVFNVSDIPANDPNAWFSETALQSVLYRLHQSPDVGFTPIYQAMAAQKQSAAHTSLFSFATSLRGTLTSNGQTALDNLLTEINTVNGANLDSFGTNQITTPTSITATNQNKVLPIYTPLAANLAKDVCTTITYGQSNKLGVYRFLRFNVANAGTQKFKVKGASSTLKPNLVVYNNGTAITGQLVKDTTATNTYNVTFNNLPVKNDFVAALKNNTSTAGGCFTVTLVPGA